MLFYITEIHCNSLFLLYKVFDVKPKTFKTRLIVNHLSIAIMNLRLLLFVTFILKGC